MHYILFYKPFNVISTFADPTGKPTLKDYIPIVGVYAAGRLDYKSEGLLLLTNDGRLIHELTNSHNTIPKTYLVQVEGSVTNESLDSIRQGIQLREPISRHDPKKIMKIFKTVMVEIVPDPPVISRPVRSYKPTTWLKMILTEGKKHQIRRITAAVGFPTLRIIRIGIGLLSIDSLQPGQWRELISDEVSRMVYYGQ
jgi:23S rRNA pseudouridine2457 synthase